MALTLECVTGYDVEMMTVHLSVISDEVLDETVSV